MNNDEHKRRFLNSKWQANPLLEVKITEDDPRWDPQTMGHKKGTRYPVKKKPAIKQYGDKGYVPSTGKGVGY